MTFSLIGKVELSIKQLRDYEASFMTVVMNGMTNGLQTSTY